MSNTKFQQAVEYTATSMKVVGALMLGVAIAPLSAFGALLAGCSISVITALRAGDRGAVAVNGAFAVANGLGIARAIGLLG
jgi:hypothetical protein